MFVLYYIILYYITVMAAGKCVCLGDTHTHTCIYGRTDVGTDSHLDRRRREHIMPIQRKTIPLLQPMLCITCMCGVIKTYALA